MANKRQKKSTTADAISAKEGTHTHTNKGGVDESRESSSIKYTQDVNNNNLNHPDTMRAYVPPDSDIDGENNACGAHTYFKSSQKCVPFSSSFWHQKCLKNRDIFGSFFWSIFWSFF